MDNDKPSALAPTVAPETIERLKQALSVRPVLESLECREALADSERADLLFIVDALPGLLVAAEREKNQQGEIERLRAALDTIANPRHGTPEEYWDVGQIGDLARAALKGAGDGD